MAKFRFKANYDTFLEFGQALQEKTGVKGEPEDIGRRHFSDPMFKAITVREATDPEFGVEDRLLGVGPDLNRIQRDLEGKLPAGDETLGQVLPANILKNMASLPIEALQAINSPIDTATQIGNTASGFVKDSFGPAQKHLRGIRDEDPDIELKREMVQGFKDMFTNPDQLTRRPLDPAVTLGGLAAPILRFGKLLPKRPGRVATNLEDPGMGMVTEGARLAGRGAKEGVKAVGRTIADKIPEGVKGIPIKEGAIKLRDLALGKTTSTSELKQRIINSAPTEGKGRIVKAYAEGGVKAQENMVRSALRAIDKVKEQVDDFQNQANDALQPHYKTGIETKAFDDLKKEARGNLRSAEAVIKGEKKLSVEKVSLDQIESQRSTTPSGVFPGGTKETRRMEPTGKIDVSFEEFPSPRATAISSRGPSQDIIIDTHKRLIEAPPTTVGALQRFMWQIDDDIRILGNEMGSQGQRHMIALRGAIRETLSDQLGEVYNAATRAYEGAMQEMYSAKISLGIEPGKISKSGTLREVDEAGISMSLLRAMDDADEFAYKHLIKLEEMSGVPLQHRIAGVSAQPMLGQNLVVTQAVVGEARQALNTVKSSAGLIRTGTTAGVMGLLLGPIVGTATGLLMSVIYSPRIMQKIMSEIHNPAKRANVRKAFAKAKKVLDDAANQGAPVSRWVHEAVTLDQALERLSNAEFHSRIDEPTDEEQPSILEATAGLPIQSIREQ
jgi:gas vesicle protein